MLGASSADPFNPPQAALAWPAHAAALPSADIHAWFQLSYSTHLVVSRTLLQSMPLPWQQQFTALLELLEDAYDTDEHRGLVSQVYKVEAAEEREVWELTEVELAAAGITAEQSFLCDADHEHDDECDPGITYTEMPEGRVMESWERALIPVPDPVPPYNRGRAHVPPRPGIGEFPDGAFVLARVRPAPGGPPWQAARIIQQYAPGRWHVAICRPGRSPWVIACTAAHMRPATTLEWEAAWSAGGTHDAAAQPGEDEGDAAETAAEAISAGQAGGLPDGFPQVVCLCGSTRFYDEFRRANLQLTLAGEIVLSIGCDSKPDGDLAASGEFGTDPVTVKARLNALHKRKIDLADYVLVLNVGGYVGDSTRAEIDYALARGKPVRYLEGDPARAIKPTTPAAG